MTRRPRRVRPPRDRRGIALIVTLVMVFAIGALSVAAIFLASSGGLLGRMADREQLLRAAADAGLQIGKSHLNSNPALLPDSGYRTIALGTTLEAADTSPVGGVSVNIYAGPTGSTTGQFGRFASVVSEAVGPLGARFVRRLELEQESFARFAYWTNHEKDPSGGTIFFANGDQLWGPVWSNDEMTIHRSGARFHDEVGTARTVVNAGAGTFDRGRLEHQTPMALPSVAGLANLTGYASAGGLAFVAPNNADEGGIEMRLEFVAVDLNGDGDATDADEGFLRAYRANPGRDTWLRGDWSVNKSSAVNCGDFHLVVSGGAPEWKFFPVATHDAGTPWASALWVAGGMTPADAAAHEADNVAGIMSAPVVAGQPRPRCYPGGDPHLVAIDGDAAGGIVAAQRGGDSTTFLPAGSLGNWLPWTGAVDPRLAAARPWDAAYLFPLSRTLNGGAKGVVTVRGSVGVSGTLRGRVTLYATGTIALIDDMLYSADPVAGRCTDMLGLIAGDNVAIADNAVNSPQIAGGLTSFDDTPDMYARSVIMTLHESFRAEHWNGGPNAGMMCDGIANGRGCLFLLGGLIQERRGAVGTTGGTGFIKRYTYDRCAVRTPPPYFPTTGRFLENRYTEIDPVRFNVTSLFAALSPR